MIAALFAAVTAVVTVPSQLLSVPGVAVEFEIQLCGDVNGFYDVEARKITLCAETWLESPGLVRYMIAHEYAHAVIRQLDVPYSGGEEAAADELAALLLAGSGLAADIDAAAVWFAKDKTPERAKGRHQSGAKRAAVLSCLARGASDIRDDNAGCRAEYLGKVRTWQRLLLLSKAGSP